MNHKICPTIYFVSEHLLCYVFRSLCVREVHRKLRFSGRNRFDLLSLKTSPRSRELGTQTVSLTAAANVAKSTGRSFLLDFVGVELEKINQPLAKYAAIRCSDILTNFPRELEQGKTRE